MMTTASTHEYTPKDPGRSIGGQKSSEGGRGDPHKASPAAVERYLKGLTYPADKKSVVSHAKNNKAPSDVMYIIEQFSERDYVSPIEIAREVGRIE